MNQPADKPRRFRIRFSLRTLLLCTLVIGLACGWLGSILHRQHRQRQVVKQIVEKGGQVAFDYQVSAAPGGKFEPRGPWLLRRCFGDDLFAYVEYVYLDESSDFVDCRPLLELPRLKRLDLGWTSVSDHGMDHLAGLTNLRELTLPAQVGDAGLKQLVTLQSLQKLTLVGPSVTDEGLKSLAQLQSLTTLNLYDANITDAGLLQLKSLRHLQWLKVDGQVTPSGAQELRKHLPNCRVTGTANGRSFQVP